MEIFIIIFVVVIFSLTIHEATHAYVGYWLGDDTAKVHGRLSFNPIKHIDPYLTILLPLILALAGMPIFGGAKPVPFNPNNIKYGEWGAALIALSGPLINFFVAFIFYGLWVFFSPSDTSLWYAFFVEVVSINLAFFVFNLIPIPPLDGSRLLYALAPDFARKFMEYLEQFGVVIVFLILAVAGTAVGAYMDSAIYFFFDIFKSVFGV